MTDLRPEDLSVPADEDLDEPMAPDDDEDGDEGEDAEDGEDVPDVRNDPVPE